MIKFGEKVAVTIIGLITFAFYAELFLLANQRLLLLVPLVLLLGLLYAIVSRSNIRRLFWCLYLYTQIGFLSLFVIVEWYSAHSVVVALAVAAAAVVTLWSRRVSAPLVFVREKPLRRAVTIFLTLAVFAYSALFHTILIFFSSFAPPLLIHFLLSVSVTIGTYLLWTLYYESTLREFFIPLSVVCLLMFETSLVAALGSAGYLVRGFGIALLWYVIQLFIRFHFGNRDIIWARQRVFLLGTGFVFVVFAFLIRFL